MSGGDRSTGRKICEAEKRREYFCRFLLTQKDWRTPFLEIKNILHDHVYALICVPSCENVWFRSRVNENI